MKEKNLRLTTKQTFELCKYIEANKDEFNGMPRNRIFEKVREALDFELNQNNVDTICVQLGVKSSHRRKEKAVKKRDGLEGALLDILDCIDDLAAIIENERNAAHCKNIYKKVEAIKFAVG